ncbi:DNase I-like protein, partial [Dentipellis sp. KUC8613]
VKKQRIGILAVQETHLNEPYLADVQRLFHRRLLILNTSDPDRPTTSAGVAFVLNKETVRTDEYRFTVLIPGRAAALTIKWRDNRTLTLLNIYGPNAPSEHANFWETLQQAWQDENLPDPDFMMGDFNLVEDAIDRSPPHEDDEAATAALQTFRTHLHLQDTWRHSHPTTKTFTFRSNSTNQYAQSRIDRIYTSTHNERLVFEWTHGAPPVPTDHHMVAVRYAPYDAPYIGPGRWTMPLHLVNDEILLKTILKEAKQLETELTNIAATGRTEQLNAQLVWLSFKTAIKKKIRQHAAKSKGKLTRQIQNLKRDAATL